MTELSLKPCRPHSNAGSFYSTIVPSNPATVHTVVKHGQTWERPGSVSCPFSANETNTVGLMNFYFDILHSLPLSEFLIWSYGLKLITFCVSFHLFLILNSCINIFSISKGLICSSRTIKGWIGLNIYSSLVGT